MKILKKIISALFLICALTIILCAFNLSGITPDDSFILYSNSPDKVCEILKVDKSELKKTVENSNILYLAVDQNNTKQIQLTYKETDFSHSISNLNNISDASINSLLPEITGMENIKGEFVYKDGQKFVKINLRSKNGENEYILTQFLTVTDKKLYTLSFYTATNVDTDYIETTFLLSNEKLKINPNKNYSIIKTAIICATVIFSIAFLILLYTILRDFVMRIKEKQEENLGEDLKNQ